MAKSPRVWNWKRHMSSRSSDSLKEWAHSNCQDRPKLSLTLTQAGGAAHAKAQVRGSRLCTGAGKGKLSESGGWGGWECQRGCTRLWMNQGSMHENTDAGTVLPAEPLFPHLPVLYTICPRLFAFFLPRLHCGYF